VQFAVLLVAGIAAGPCGGAGTDPTGITEDAKNFTVIMRHHTGVGAHPIHIFVLEREQRQPVTLLNAGGSRGYLVPTTAVCDHENDLKCKLTFIADRDPSATVPYSTDVTCEWEPNTTPANAEVRWTGSALVCAGWEQAPPKQIQVTVTLVNERNNYAPPGLPPNDDVYMLVEKKGEQPPCCLVARGGGRRTVSVDMSARDTIWVQVRRADGSPGSRSACMIRGGVTLTANLRVRLNEPPGPPAGVLWCEEDGVYYPPY
jgi:hypothetical protein